MKRLSKIQNRGRRSQAGISLIETMIALGILLIVSVGILAMTALSISTTENQGHLAARTAEYAQDKMEQLLSLSFNDTKTDTSVASFVAEQQRGFARPGSRRKRDLWFRGFGICRLPRCQRQSAWRWIKCAVGLVLREDVEDHRRFFNTQAN